MRDGSKKWLPSHWEELLGLTIEAMTSIADRKPIWTFGGGTSLAIDLKHRISYDIDAFVDSASLIKELIPNVNEVTKRVCWNSVTQRADFHWPGHYLKLFVMDKGEIDFINASTVVDNPTFSFNFGGSVVQRERPAEVIAKKIRNRSSTFKPRDAFDLAAVFINCPAELEIAAQSPFLFSDAYKRISLGISLRKQAFQQAILEEVNPTEYGSSFIEEAADTALEAISFMRSKSSLENNDIPTP